MSEFSSSLLSWQLFFATVATASATLTGLLFVSLSLRKERFSGQGSSLIKTSARRAFSDFLHVLMIAIVFLVPHKIPLSLTVALVVLGISRGFGLFRDYYRNWRKLKQKMSGRTFLREFGLPAMASIGLIAIAVAVLIGMTDSIYWLVGVIAALLLSACWRAWLLLVEE